MVGIVSDAWHSVEHGNSEASVPLLPANVAEVGIRGLVIGKHAILHPQQKSLTG